jgi:hypothetical protein
MAPDREETTRGTLRVGLALLTGGVIAALAMSVLLAVFANIDAHQPLMTDLTLSHLVGMTVFFCFFTVPIAVVVGAPLYVLLRRSGLLRVSGCSAVGGVVGLVVPYAFRLGGDGWMAMVWFGLSGAAAGAMMGVLLRGAVKRQRP